MNLHSISTTVMVVAEIRNIQRIRKEVASDRLHRVPARIFVKIYET